MHNVICPPCDRLDSLLPAVRVEGLGGWGGQSVWLFDRRAVTALEYGIIASILGLALVGIFRGFGTTLTGLFTHVGSSI